MKQRWWLLGLTCATLSLEVFFRGAVLQFGMPDGESIRRVYSYFGLMPFGYANVGPFFTALLTVALLVLCLLRLRFAQLQRAIGIVGAIAVCTSLTPLMFGVAYFSVVGAVITLLLCCITVSAFIRKTK